MATIDFSDEGMVQDGFFRKPRKSRTFTIYENTGPEDPTWQIAATETNGIDSIQFSMLDVVEQYIQKCRAIRTEYQKNFAIPVIRTRDE